MYVLMIICVDTASILPIIIIPIVLIFVKTFWGLFGTGEGVANTIISLVGEPIFALGVGTNHCNLWTGKKRR